MDVDYDLTLDDFVDFNVSHHRRSPFLRRVTLTLFILAAIVIPVAIARTLYVSSQDEDKYIETSGKISLIIVGVASFAVAVGLALWVGRRGFCGPLTRWGIRRMLAEGDLSSMVGRRRMRLTADALIETSPDGESTIRISAIQKIVVTRRHIFLYVGPVQAFIIPRRALLAPGDAEELVACVEELSHRSAEWWKH